jgi:hypothetical protein
MAHSRPRKNSSRFSCQSWLQRQRAQLFSLELVASHTSFDSLKTTTELGALNAAGGLFL